MAAAAARDFSMSHANAVNNDNAIDRILDSCHHSKCDDSGRLVSGHCGHENRSIVAPFRSSNKTCSNKILSSSASISESMPSILSSALHSRDKMKEYAITTASATLIIDVGDDEEEGGYMMLLERST